MDDDRESELFELIADEKMSDEISPRFEQDVRKVIPDVTHDELVEAVVSQGLASVMMWVEATAKLLDTFAPNESDRAKETLARQVAREWPEIQKLIDARVSARNARPRLH